MESMSLIGDFDKAIQQVGEKNLSLEVVDHKAHITLPAGYLGKIKEAIGLLLNNELQHYSPSLCGLPVAFNKGKVRLLSQVGSVVGSHIHFDVQTEFVVFRPKLEDVLQGIVNKQEEGQISCLCHGFFYAYIRCSKRRSLPQIGEIVLFKVTKLEEDGSGFLSIIGEYVRNLSRPSISGEPDSGIDEDQDILNKSASSITIPSPVQSPVSTSAPNKSDMSHETDDKKIAKKKKKSKHKKKSKTREEKCIDDMSRDQSANDVNHCDVTLNYDSTPVQHKAELIKNTVNDNVMQSYNDISMHNDTEKVSEAGYVCAGDVSASFPVKTNPDSQSSDDINTLLSFKRKDKKHKVPPSDNILNETKKSDSLLSDAMDISYATDHNMDVTNLPSLDNDTKKKKHKKKDKKLKKKKKKKDLSPSKLNVLSTADAVSAPSSTEVNNSIINSEAPIPSSSPQPENKGSTSICDSYQALLKSSGLSKKEKKIIKCLLKEKKKKLKRKKHKMIKGVIKDKSDTKKSLKIRRKNS